MRILVTGPECTGKTTIAKALSDHLKIPWVPEYARTYISKLNRPYQYDDLLSIAQGQMKLYTDSVAEGPFVMDTFLINIYIWSLEKYGKVEPWIAEHISAVLSFDYILLMYPDLEWKQDGMRENPKDQLRLFYRFEKVLNDLAKDYDIIKGAGHARFEETIKKFKGKPPIYSSPDEA